MWDPDKEVPSFVKQFVIAVRCKSRQDSFFSAPTRDSIIKLILEVQQHLKDKHNRIGVLQAITGLPISSSNQLTQYTVSTIIDEVINVRDIHPTTLTYIEELLASRTALKAWDLFPWERPSSSSVPSLPESDSPF